jgi:hypothetical protein
LATIIKVFYSLAVAALLILFVAFGIRTFYEGPDEPGGRYYGEQSAWQEYENDRTDYHRNVFLVAGLLGLASVVAGVVIPHRLDAMRLGLLMGGLGVIAYAVAQAGDDLGEMGAEPIFGVAAVGLIVLLLVGYRWLGGWLVQPREKG